MAKQRLFIVDNDQKTLRVLEASLLKEGYSITTCLDGADALEKIRLSPPDLIISEVVLPQMSGYEFLKKVKENPSTRSIPFIFLTRLKSVSDKVKGLEMGVDDYLTKPIYLKEVLTRVKLLLEKREKEKIEMPGTEPRFSGSLSDIGIVDLIQTLELGNKMAVVYLTKGEKKGVMYFKKGKIVDAECGTISGDKAVYRLVNWSDGTFRVDFEEVTREDRIGQSNQALIMEGMRRIDELVRIQEQLPRAASILVIDSQAVLSEHPQQFPARVEELMAEFDGKSTIEEVVDRSGHDDLEAYETIAKLYFQGFLVNSSAEPQSPLIFTKPSPAQREEESSSFLTPPGETVEEKAEEEAPFLKAPQEVEIQDDAGVPEGREGTRSVAPAEPEASPLKEQPAAQRDSKVIFLKPSQLAERYKVKDAKGQRNFWEDEPLISSLEKVLTSTQPAPAREEPIPPPIPLKKEGRVPAVSIKRARPEPVRAGPSAGPVMWKVLAVAVPPLVVVAALFAGKDYVMSRISPAVSATGRPPAPTVESLMQAGKESEALALLEKDLARDPLNPRGLYLRGIIKIKDRATADQGLEDLKRAMVLSPNDKDAAVALGAELQRRKQTTDAIMILKRAVELDPLSSRPYRILGLIYMDKGDPQNAVAMLDKAVEIDPADGAARQSLEEAKAYLEKTAAKAPGDAPRPKTRPQRTASSSAAKPVRKQDQSVLHYKNAKGLYEEGKIKEAVIEYRLALLSAPDNAGILVDLGNALFDDGNDKDAVAALEKALALDPNNSRAHMSLGGIYSTKGDKARALYHYRKFLDIEPSGPSADEVRTIVKNLGG